MGTPLPLRDATKAIEKLKPHLTPGYQRLISLLAAQLDEDGRVQVAQALEELFPASENKNSANTQLNRLIRTANDTAASARLALRLHVTPGKKLGAEQRQIWCEGEPAGAGEPDMPDLRQVSRQGVLTEQLVIELRDPVVLLVTFNTNESEAVIAQFGNGRPGRTFTIGDQPVSDLGDIRGSRIWHMVTKQGRLGVATALPRVLAEKRVQAVIALGIAFGMDENKQSIGDVLVAERVRDYELGRANSDGSFTPRGETYPADGALIARARHLLHQPSTPGEGRGRVRLGTILSGDKLMDNRRQRQKLLKIEPEAIGGEMEGAGVAAACADARTPWIMVKAICDWGDGTVHNADKEPNQKRAARAAAVTVRDMLEIGPLAISPGTDNPLPARPRLPSARMTDLDAMPPQQMLRDVEGRCVSLDKDDLARTRTTHEGPGEHVQEYLRRWLHDLDGPPLLALLGEYGMGKTITCQCLATDMAEARKTDPHLPIPLYFDLRHVSGLTQRVPTAEQTLSECMDRGWITDETGKPHGMTHVWDWIAQGAVAIIDGLDEVLVKLSAADGQIFTNGLLKLLTDARARTQGRSSALRMVIACRTSYFPTLRDQQTHFTRQERGDIQGEQYRGLLLLPWRDEQVVKYLSAALPDSDVARVMQTVGSVHNLTELAARPFTLRLIADHIPAIEQLRVQGRPVQGVTLYRLMAQRWLERDDGKHHILKEHKLHLARHLAAYLWRHGMNVLTADALQSWFHAWRQDQPNLRRYATMPVEQLEEDLRTATFLSRQDDDKGSGFRFAHTSLLEFFLADYLFQAAREDRPTDWALPLPSRETLDFLGQMFAEAGGVPPALRGWCRPYRPQTSELLLDYALRARAGHYPLPDLRGIQLHGADLSGRVIGEPGPFLDLTGADLSDCTLREAELTCLDLTGADLSGVVLDRAILMDCRLDRARLRRARITGTRLRRVSLTGADWTAAMGDRPEFTFCPPAPLPDGAQVFPVPGGRDRSARLTLATGHQGGVWACAWSPAGDRLLSAGQDGTIRIWDVVTGHPIATITGHESEVSACAWSPTGDRLLSAGEDGTIRTWDAVAFNPIATITGHRGGVTACAFSPSGDRLLSAGQDGTIRTWDAVTGTAIATITGHEGEVWACAWSPAGDRLLSAGFDGTIRMWDAVTGTSIASITGHQGWVKSCAWSPSGDRLLSAGADCTIRIWDADAANPIATITGHNDWVRACAWSAQGDRLLSAGDDGTIRMWDAVTLNPIATINGHQGGVRACAWSPTGDRLLAAGNDGSIRMWDAVTFNPIATINGHQGGVEACAWSPQGDRLLSAGDDGTIRTWDAVTGSPIATITGHKGGVWACNWSPAGDKLLSTGHDGTFRMWDAVTFNPIARITGDQHEVWACAWSPAGDRLLSAGDDGTIRVWDAVTFNPIATITGDQHGVWACAWSPAGDRLLSAGIRDTIRIWDAITFNPIATITGHQDMVFACAWSPAGDRLISAGYDGTIRMWDAVTGKPIATITGHQGGVLACAFSPAGDRLLSAGQDGTIRIWDAVTFNPIATITGHRGGVRACAWSPDGDRLLSAGDDGTIRTWDARTGTLLRVHCAWRTQDRPGHAVWDPQNDHILSATDDAWRYLHWQYRKEDGRLDRLPLEAFGPIVTVPAA